MSDALKHLIREMGASLHWPLDEGTGSTYADVTGNGRTGTPVGTISPVPGYGSIYRELVMAADPSLYWALDSLTTTTDLSGNGRNASAQGGISAGGASGCPVGNGTATAFNGSNQWYTSSYNPFTIGSSRTWMGWANRTSHATIDIIFGGAAGSAVEPAFWLNANNNPSWRATLAGAETDTITEGWPGDGIWTHWAFVFDDGGNAIALYIDGTNIGGAITHSETYNAAPGNFTLGQSLTGGGNPWLGSMAHVSVFEYAMGASTIAALAAAGRRTDQRPSFGGSGGGAALYLDGQNNQMIQTGSFNNGYGPWSNVRATTCQGWVYWPQNVGGIMVGSNGNSGGGPSLIEFFVNGDGSSSITYNNGGTNAAFGQSGFVAGRWQHWAVVFRPTQDNASLYVDGLHISTPSYTTDFDLVNGINPLTVGAYAGGGFGEAEARFAHVAAFERELTASEIFRLYKTGATGLGMS